MLQVKLEVYTIEGFSGHSSRRQLMNFLYKLSPKPKKIIIGHGESTKCLEFASAVHKLNHVETVAPRNLESIRVR